MLKKIGFTAIALLAGALALVPQQAKAAVRFGVVVQPPVYTYPAYSAYDNCAPAPAVVAPAPVVIERRIVRRDVRWDRRHDFDRDGRYDRDFRR